MSAPEPNTPGIFGYVAAVGIGLLVVSTLIIFTSAFFYVSELSQLVFLVLYVPIGAVEIGVLGCPVVLASVLLTHVLCRRIRFQSVHVVVSALGGILLTVTYAQVLGHMSLEIFPVFLALAAGAGAAVGRAAVVPLVHSRQRLAAAGRLTGTARW